MKKFWKWFIGILAGLLVLAILIGLPLLSHYCWGLRGGFPSQMHGFGMTPFRHIGMMPFGGIFGGLFQLGLLALIVLGIVWLFRKVMSPRVPPLSCAKCGKPVQPDWKVCPYCGTKR